MPLGAWASRPRPAEKHISSTCDVFDYSLRRPRARRPRSQRLRIDNPRIIASRHSNIQTDMLLPKLESLINSVDSWLHLSIARASSALPSVRAAILHSSFFIYLTIPPRLRLRSWFRLPNCRRRNFLHRRSHRLVCRPSLSRQ